MVADRGNGRVLGRGHGRTVLTYRLGHDESRRLLLVLSAMGRVLFAAVRRMHLAAFHPTGTAAAGSDPRRHPVDERGRLRGVDGVTVADASILPSCPEVNPQVSIMALAIAAAEEVRRQ
jgi:choline dehydrogenase-like flavoprotein